MAPTLLHWIRAYGYLGVFVSLMLGMFGLPVPDESIMTFTGFLIYESYLQPIPAVLAAFSGSVCGITLNYGVGRAVGWPLVKKYGRYVHLTDEKIERAHRWFEKYGKWALLAGYFFPGLRHLTAFAAGAARLEYRLFAPFVFAGGFLWVISFIALGYFLGEEWPKVMPAVQKYLWAAVGLVAALGCAIFLGRKLRRRDRANQENRRN